MSFFRFRSLRARIIALVIASIVLAQAAGLAMSVWQDMSRYAEGKRDGLVATAQVLAASAARATAERDVDAAYQAIRAVGRIPNMSFVGLESADGRPLADVGATEQLVGDLVIERPDQQVSFLALFSSRSIEINVPVVFRGETVGSLRLIADTADLGTRIRAAIGVTGAGALAALLLALGLALRLQGAITAPLRALTGAMSRVSRDHDYSVAMPARTQDEIGVMVDGFNAMIADIRDRDERLARHREGLEREVAARTADYRRAAAEADAANEAKSSFLATMSHEIRTPMNGILVMAEMLATTELPPQPRRQAEIIAKSGQSLLAIINDILDFSKIEAGKLDVEAVDVDPADAADAVLHLFADKAMSKGLDLAMNFRAPRGLTVKADPVRLGQVLANLVNNALKFTEQGGVTVEIAESGGRVSFAVRDTGIGIPPEKLASIFEAFSQAERSTTRTHGGTGLGLAIARKLVDAMGGELQVSSATGEGSVFGFSLPVGTEAGRPWRRLAGRPERLAICIEGAQTAEALAADLEEAGYAPALVEAASLAEEGREASVVIADAAALRRGPRPQAARVIVLARPHDDVAPLIEAGVADVALIWPVRRPDIEAALDRGSPQARGAANAPAAVAVAGDAAGPIRVLVADDSEVNREVAATALRRLGVTPDLVENGRQALDAMLAEPYHIVLMDGSMPVLDGFAATKLLRREEAARGAPRTPVVALTAHVVGSDADAWREAGMDGVLHKPFTLAQLAATLEAHARAALPERDAAAAPVSSEVSSTSGDGVDLRVLSDLKAMADGSTDIVARIARLYIDQSAFQVEAILEAVRAHDLEKLAAASHALKSMSANIGARAVADRAGRFEALSRIEGLSPGESEVSALAAELEAAHRALGHAIA
jgi:two-component system sensor histidine kinase BarA